MGTPATTRATRVITVRTYEVEGGIVSGDWFVVPGSGTAELVGLRGEGGFRANLGEGAQVHLDYWFE